MVKRFRPIVVLGVFLSLFAIPASAAVTYRQLSLSAAVDGSSVTVTATVQASSNRTVDRYGVCVRTSTGAGADFRLDSSTVVSTGGTSYTATKTFVTGTYSYFSCLRVAGTWTEVGARRTFTVGGSSAPAPAPSPSPPSPGVPTRASGYWWSDFQSPTALTFAGGNPAPGAEWSGWGNGDTANYGIPHLVSASSEGLSSPPAGDRVVKLRYSGPQSPFGADQASGPHNMHKLYKDFTTKTWPSGTEPTNPADGAPADVSGRYITYLYLKSDQFHLVPGFWSNVMQFKESYRGTDGSFNSNPSWWVGFNADNINKPVMNLSSSGGTHRGVALPLSQFYDRWTKMELRVVQHDRIEWYVNDVLVDTGYDKERRVGRADYPGQRGTSGNTVAKSYAWTFGAGNYTNGNDHPAAASGVYVDLSCLLPLH